MPQTLRRRFCRSQRTAVRAISHPHVSVLRMGQFKSASILNPVWSPPLWCYNPIAKKGQMLLKFSTADSNDVM